MSGFNHRVTGTGVTDQEGWSILGSGFTQITNVSRWTGLSSMGFDHQTATRGFIRTLPGGVTRANLGASFGFQKVVANTSGVICQFRETSATVHVDIRHNTDGQLIVTRNGTLLGTGTTVFANSVWHHIEWWVEIHDTAGVIKVWVDGNPTPEINLSSQDTRNGGTGVVDRVYFFGSNISNSSRWNYTDLVIYDDLGGVNDTAPLGDIRVKQILPSGNGNSSQWVGSDANSTDNYLLVDEVPRDDDTTYVESSVVGDKDTYAFGDLGVTGSVLAVRTLMYAKKTDANVRQIATVARLSSTEVDGETETLTTDYAGYSEVRETKPGGGAWTASDVDSTEFGVKVIA